MPRLLLSVRDWRVDCDDVAVTAAFGGARWSVVDARTIVKDSAQFALIRGFELKFAGADNTDEFNAGPRRPRS